MVILHQLHVILTIACQQNCQYLKTKDVFMLKITMYALEYVV